MTRVVILGAGISGHTAALHLQRQMNGKVDIVVVSPNSNWNWIPSNIWVGVGKMTKDQVTFPLAPVYKRKHIGFRQAKAVSIHPEGNVIQQQPFVDIVYTDPSRAGEEEQLTYDYLIVATGPKLNFAATPGLGPDGNSWSVCTAGHAEQSAAALETIIEALKAGERKTLVIGVGHGTCTCEGAAFEYTFNVEHELRERGVRELADVVYLSNEYDLGDLGVGGMTFAQNGFETSSKMWTESLFRERGVRAILRAHVEKVDPGLIHYEELDGSKHELAFDFAMLLPPFRGVDMKAYANDGHDITDDLFAPNGFLRRGQALRAVGAGRLAQDLSVPALRERLRRRHCLRATARHIRTEKEPQRNGHLAGAAANRDAFGGDGSHRGALDRRSHSTG